MRTAIVPCRVQWHPKEDGAKSLDKPNVARHRSERDAFSALDCQCWKAHPAEHTNKSNGQRNKKQTGDPLAQACLERKRRRHDCDNSATQ
jgi:hypothetical protein